MRLRQKVIFHIYQTYHIIARLTIHSPVIFLGAKYAIKTSCISTAAFRGKNGRTGFLRVNITAAEYGRMGFLSVMVIAAEVVLVNVHLKTISFVYFHITPTPTLLFHFQFGISVIYDHFDFSFYNRHL